MALLTLTRFDGQLVEIPANSVARVRQTEKDYDGPNGRSRVDWGSRTDLFNDMPAEIAADVHKEISTFISLPQPGGKPVWFDGHKASGPVYVPPQKLPGSDAAINSALMIGSRVQYVRSTPDEVYEAIKAQGGNATPPYKVESGEIETLNHWFSASPELWDAGMYPPLVS